MSDATQPDPSPSAPGDVFVFFLGDGIDAADPASLFSLEGDGPWSDAQIVRGLKSRLEQLNAHPHRATPQADELRFALHAAAAKMLGAIKPAPAAPVELDASGREPAMPPAMRQQMLRIVASCGGWSREAMRRVTAIGVSQGVDPATLALWLTRLQQEAGTPSPAAAAARSMPPATPRIPGVMEPASQRDSSRTLVNIIGWVLGGLLATLAVAAAALVILMQRPAANRASGAANPPATGPETVVAATPPKEVAAPAAKVATPTPAPNQPVAIEPAPETTTATRATEWLDLVARMEAAVPLLRSGQREGLQKFESAYGAMAQQWIGAAPDQRTRAVNGVIDAIFAAAGSSDVADRVLGALASSSIASPAVPAATEVLPTVWTSGIVARLSRERELPRLMVRRIDELASSLFGQAGVGEATFEAGVSSAVLAMASSLVPLEPQLQPELIKEREAKWQRWVEACRAAGDGAFFGRTVLVALDRLLTAAPEPTRDESVFHAVSDLVCAITWRQDDASRTWLLSKFDAPAVSADDLHVVTAALATRSGAPGVDATMVLGQGASATERAKLREQYASVWAVKPPPSKLVVHAKWIEAARRELDRTDVADEPFAQGVEAVALSRLCEGAWLLHAETAAGDASETQSEVDLLLLDLDRGLSKRLSSLASASSKAVISLEETDWASRYATAQLRIAERVQLLTTCGETPTAAEARIIVNEAFRGSPEKVQAAAQAAVRRLGASPAIIAAMLEEAPFIPQTGGNTELLRAVASAERIPNVKDASWRVAVRRALVERLLELLAGDGVISVADAVGDAMAETYAARLPRGGAVTQTPTAEQAAEKLFAAALRQAKTVIPTGREPVSVNAILSNKSARERLASGRVQLFAAQQASLCEVLAYLAACERPDQADEVNAVLAEFAATRQRSQHVFTQIHAAERAMVRLWLIRMGETPKGGPS